MTNWVFSFLYWTQFSRNFYNILIVIIKIIDPLKVHDIDIVDVYLKLKLFPNVSVLHLTVRKHVLILVKLI